MWVVTDYFGCAWWCGHYRNVFVRVSAPLSTHHRLYTARRRPRCIIIIIGHTYTTHSLKKPIGLQYHYATSLEMWLRAPANCTRIGYHLMEILWTNILANSEAGGRQSPQTGTGRRKRTPLLKVFAGTPSLSQWYSMPCHSIRRPSHYFLSIPA